MKLGTAVTIDRSMVNIRSIVGRPHGIPLFLTFARSFVDLTIDRSNVYVRSIERHAYIILRIPTNERSYVPPSPQQWNRTPQSHLKNQPTFDQLQRGLFRVSLLSSSSSSASLFHPIIIINLWNFEGEARTLVFQFSPFLFELVPKLEGFCSKPSGSISWCVWLIPLSTNSHKHTLPFLQFWTILCAYHRSIDGYSFDRSNVRLPSIDPWLTFDRSMVFKLQHLLFLSCFMP